MDTAPGIPLLESMCVCFFGIAHFVSVTELDLVSEFVRGGVLVFFYSAKFSMVKNGRLCVLFTFLALCFFFLVFVLD